MVSCGDAKKKGAVRGCYRTAGQEGIILHPDSLCRDIKSSLHQEHNGKVVSACLWVSSAKALNDIFLK